MKGGVIKIDEKIRLSICFID